MRTLSLVKVATAASVILVFSPVYLKADTGQKEHPAKEHPAMKSDVAAPAEEGQTVRAPEKIKTYITRTTKVTQITGSYIPRKVKRVGPIQDSPYHVTIYDREYISRTGAQTVGAILARDPSITVRGTR